MSLYEIVNTFNNVIYSTFISVNVILKKLQRPQIMVYILFIKKEINYILYIERVIFSFLTLLMMKT